MYQYIETKTTNGPIIIGERNYIPKNINIDLKIE